MVILEKNLLLDPQINLTRHPEFTPPRHHNCNESQSRFYLKVNASDDLHEVTLGLLLTTQSKESIN